MSTDVEQIEQRVLASILLEKGAITVFVENSYEVDQVFSDHKDLAKLIFQHYHDFHVVPTYEILNKTCSKLPSSALLLDQITEIQLAEPDVDQIEYWVKQLIELNRKNIVHKGLLAATDAITSGDVNLATKLLEKTAIESQDLLNRNQIKVGDLGADAKERYQEYLFIKENPDYHKRIPTGFKGLDDNIGGVGAGELNIMLGRPGHGKSMFLLNIAYNAWKDYEKNVFFFSYEMPIKQVEKRLDSRHAMLDYNKIKTGNLADLELKRYEAMLKDMSKRNKRAVFKIFQPPQKTTTALVRNLIEKYEKTEGIRPDLIVLDYMSLMAPMRLSKDQKEQNRLGEIALDCRALGVDLAVPIWTACQINRAGAKEKQVDTTNIYQSDEIAHHADMILGLKRNEGDIDQFTNSMEIQAVKVRDGACKNIEIYYDFSFCMMTDKAPEGFS